MSDLRIITNNHARPIIEAYELTQAERQEFDYHDWEKIDAGEDGAQFFRYKGRLFDLGEFMPVNSDGDFKEWDGASGDSYFSGKLVRYSDDCGYAPCHPGPDNTGLYAMTHDPNTYGEYVVAGWYCS